MIILDGFTLSRVAACISFGHGCKLWTMKSWPVLSNLISKYNINLSSLSWTYNQRMTSKMHSSRSTMDAHTVSRLPFFLYFHFSGPKGKGILIGAIFALPHRSVMTTLQCFVHIRISTLRNLFPKTYPKAELVHKSRVATLFGYGNFPSGNRGWWWWR